MRSIAPTDILQWIADHTNKVTAKETANRFVVEHKVYGRQQFVNTMIANFRKLGWVEDVERCTGCEKCDGCGRALTRGQKNRPLVITEKGLEVLAKHNAGN